jgi:hypothetical protein
VSFETGLFVRDEGRYFAESSSAFGSETVNSFVKTLFTIRVFIDPDHEPALKALPPSHNILHIMEKWLNL